MGTKEAKRLADARSKGVPWKRWGPYLSERQWGTVREDQSHDGDAWSYLPHDHARSRAYRWGEDGIAGISDDEQRLCFAVSMWNGHDQILKERLFGLTNTEGNHGEDVKEYYSYLDNTPTHSWMEHLYKYPQASYPYDDLVETNARRGYHDLEYELIDTGVFDDDRYFDVFVRYAKDSPDDILIEIEAWNRGPEPAPLHLVPTLWFRNTWFRGDGSDRPALSLVDDDRRLVIRSEHPTLGTRHLYVDHPAQALFTENETNTQRLWGQPNATPWVKDGIGEFLIAGRADAVNPMNVGTKAGVLWSGDVEPGGSVVLRLRLTDVEPHQLEDAYPKGDPLGTGFRSSMRKRRAEADDFYGEITPDGLDRDAAAVFRQALAGMLWSKQYFGYDVVQWFADRGILDRPAIAGSGLRNAAWFPMVGGDIISMPDTWEYPWFAAWDLAFHTIPLAIVDLDFAKTQLELVLNERYLHPNGQIPAYEWNFSDVNPPVHAWAVMRVYEMEREATGRTDIEFLQRSFHKLSLNYTWWVNQKDPDGNDLFGGGFLGLDNIGVFDRSAPLPTGGQIEQADGTSWMAFYALSMLEMAIELALHDPTYQSMASKFFEHFLWIADAMNARTEHDLWDEEDGFFYDIIRFPDGSAWPMKVRSLVGLLPLAACVVLRPSDIKQLPDLIERVIWLNEHRPDLVRNIPTLSEPGVGDRRLLAVLSEGKLQRILSVMLDETEFLSDHGIRSVSKFHEQHPYTLEVHGAQHRVTYLPAESDSGMFGGNSNWRGPVWFPMNFLLIRGLIAYYAYYGEDLTVECPTGSGVQVNLWDAAMELSKRLTGIFLLDADGRRPVFGGNERFQTDPLWRDHVPFYEYFHGDNGAGLGASHQTGWTGLTARLLQILGDQERIRQRLRPPADPR